MLDADAVINNSSQKVGGSNAYPDPAPENVGGSGPRRTHRIYAPAFWCVLSLLFFLCSVVFHLFYMYTIASCDSIMKLRRHVQRKPCNLQARFRKRVHARVSEQSV